MDAGGRATHGAVAEFHNAEAGYFNCKMSIHDLFRVSLACTVSKKTVILVTINLLDKQIAI